MKKTLITLLFPIFITSFACSKHDASLVRSGNATQVNLNDTVTLSVGDSAVIKSENLLITYEGVPSDSRCPINANCVWAGDAIMNFKLYLPGKVTSFDLHTAYDVQNQKIIQNYIIKFVSLQPNQVAGTVTKQDDYKVSILIKPVPAFLVKGVVKDYTGLDGCGLVIELENGKKIEPRTGVNVNLKNKRVALKYTAANAASICMVGTVADVNEIYEIVE